MSMQDQRDESTLPLHESEPVGIRHCKRRIAFTVFGFFTLFCLTLGIGFLHQNSTRAKMDAYFQARRVVDMWDKEFSKRKAVIRKSNELPKWALSSDL
ncbi:hypothetical protein, partial [Candidatus Similichlamydia epinepheli]|uniref:hypothetical protein n=1 Tax=Candidatus Similichlamydia epinepheli TaxID=1903953 RepID=UPI0013001A95